MEKEKIIQMIPTACEHAIRKMLLKKDYKDNDEKLFLIFLKDKIKKKLNDRLGVSKGVDV